MKFYYVCVEQIWKEDTADDTKVVPVRILGLIHND